MHGIRSNFLIDSDTILGIFHELRPERAATILVSESKGRYFRAAGFSGGKGSDISFSLCGRFDANQSWIGGRLSFDKKNSDRQ